MIWLLMVFVALKNSPKTQTTYIVSHFSFFVNTFTTIFAINQAHAYFDNLRTLIVINHYPRYHEKPDYSIVGLFLKC